MTYQVEWKKFEYGVMCKLPGEGAEWTQEDCDAVYQASGRPNMHIPLDEKWKQTPGIWITLHGETDSGRTAGIEVGAFIRTIHKLFSKRGVIISAHINERFGILNPTENQKPYITICNGDIYGK